MVMVDECRFVVVSGPPGSGKSTLAPQLAHRLRLPLLAKDTIKETLMTNLDVGHVEDSQRLGRASIAVLCELAQASPIGAVLESVWSRTIATDELRRLPGPIVEVFCRCDRDTALGRARRRAGSRHPGHFDEHRSDEQLWNDENAQPIAGAWPVVEIDTGGAPVNLNAVVGKIVIAFNEPDVRTS